MSISLHLHPLSSYCWKVLIALYENGTPFEAQMVNFGDPVARAAFVALWPTAKIPLMIDDGEVLPESSIMIEQLNQRHPGLIDLLPGDPPALLQLRLWDRLFDLYVMTPMQQFIAQLLRPPAERDAPSLDAARANLQMTYELIESRWDERTWAAGEDFSMADCAAAPALFYAAIVQPFSPQQRQLQAYFERLMARPSVQRVIAEARPYFQYFPLHEAIPPRFLADAA